MKLFCFEVKKLFRSIGFKYFFAALLIINFLFCLLGELYSPENDEYITSYEGNISYVIRVAERNLLEYEATTEGDHYMIRYQRDVIKHYTNLLEDGVCPVKVQGWNEFFDNKADDLLSMLAAILAGVLLSMVEFDNGTDKVLYMTTKGRRCIAVKILVLAFCSLIFFASMLLSGLIGIALRFGLSSPLAPICSVEAFAYCPYRITIIEYLTYSFLIKALNLFCLSLFAALTAVIVRSYLAPIALSIGMVGAGYLISVSTSANAGYLFNFYVSALTDPLFERYRSVNIFERSIPLIAVTVIILMSICILEAIILHRCFLRSFSSSHLAGAEKMLLGYIGRLISGMPRIKPRRRSLLFSETKKAFVKSHLLILCAVMICIKIGFCSANEVKSDPAEDFYRSKCYELCGELTDGKRTLISEKLLEGSEVISKYESKRQAVVSGLITNDEYQAYLNEYSRASVEQFAYIKLSAQCARIDNAANRGIEAQLIYDTGWIAFFESGSDIIFYIFLLLFFSGIYENEYKTGFYRIAQTTACGMRALHKSKLLLTLIVTVAAFAVFSGIDMIFLLRSFELSNASFSFASVIETAYSMPIWFAMLLKYLVGTVISVLFSVTVCMFSRFLKKTYLVISAGLLIVWFIAH